MNELELKHIIEATLLAAGRPVTRQQLLDLFDERERPSPEQLQAALELLAADYEQRGIELIEVASGWRIQVRPRHAEVVSRLWQERPARYSRALLETLALIAYRQPITRSEIEEIRGVSISSTIMRTLQERNWIRVVGHREVPGRPELLGTTREFLDYFGLKSLDQLPTLAELKDVETIGVQLELPSGEVTSEAAAEAAEAQEGSPDEVAAQAQADASGEPTEEPAAIAGGDEQGMDGPGQHEADPAGGAPEAEQQAHVEPAHSQRAHSESMDLGPIPSELAGEDPDKDDEESQETALSGEMDEDEEGEVSAQARDRDEEADEDEEASPTLVASAQDDALEPARVREPSGQD